MAETTLLRQNAIVRNASQGNPPPHGPVKTGELPLVQVKMTPGGPQVQEGQQKPVTILPPRDGKSAITTGGLPMVQVKMTQNGPQIDDGQDRQVVIRDGKQQTVAAGNLPMVQVKMENGRPQVQNAPQQQSQPPRIPGAAPALSAPRHAQSAVAGPRINQSTPTGMGIARVAAPQSSQSVPLPDVPAFSPDQLMLFRHLAEGFLAQLRETGTAEGAEQSSSGETIQLVEQSIKDLDEALVATAIRAEAAAKAAAQGATAQAPAPVGNAYVAPRPVTGGHFSPASISPQPPRGGYVARRPGGVRQGNASMAPRRVQRAAQEGGGLPMVQVKMDGQRAVVQNQAEIAEAKAALAAQQAAAAAAEAPTVPAEAPVTASVEAPATNADAQG